MPNSHKLALTTNPNAEVLLARARDLADRFEGSLVEFLYHGRKGVAFIAVETTDERGELTFKELVEALSDLGLDPAGIETIGPINVYTSESRPPI